MCLTPTGSKSWSIDAKTGGRMGMDQVAEMHPLRLCGMGRSSKICARRLEADIEHACSPQCMWPISDGHDDRTLATDYAKLTVGYRRERRC